MGKANLNQVFPDNDLKVMFPKMTNFDQNNTDIPEEVACYAKEIFDNLTLHREVSIPFPHQKF